MSSRQDSRIKKKGSQHSIGRNGEAFTRNKSKEQVPKGRGVKTVSASQIRGLVAVELRDMNRGDIAASYTGQTPENTLGDQSVKQKEMTALLSAVVFNILENLLIETESFMI